MWVGCGKCLGCRSLRSRQWAYRLMCELSFNPRALFLTFTYDDAHYQESSLNKRDFQLFMKRLRKNLPDRVIKYYTVGEYGEDSFRKHFHSIMFGVYFDDTEIIKREWYYGFVDVAPVEIGSIAYTVGYVSKKLFGRQKSEYESLGYEPPFNLTSKNLGVEFIYKYYDDLERDMFGSIFGVKYSLPRYFRERLNLVMENQRYSDYVLSLQRDTLDKLSRRYGFVSSESFFAKEFEEFNKQCYLNDTYFNQAELELKIKNKIFRRNGL